jgi:L-rhamnono-1,4-lactonase
MLQPELIAALRWLGQHNLMYDVGVDARSVGEHKLRELCKMLLLFNETTDTKLKFIINHLGKPNLQPDFTSGSDHFKRWARSILQISTFQRTYMKLSGLFSEMPAQMPGQPAPIKDLVDHLTPWVDVIFSALGPDRIVFGSDWPVCNLNRPGPDLSWKHWHDVVEALLDSLQLSEEAKAMVWGGTAAKVYGIYPWP